MAYRRETNLLVPLALTRPERPYGTRLLINGFAVTRLVAELLLVDSVFLLGYVAQISAPPVATAAKMTWELVSRPAFHRWLLFWSAYLFVTCY